MMWDGGPAPEVTLTAYEGHTWVAVDNGWIVKAYARSTIRHKSEDGMSDATVSRSISLTGACTLTDTDLADRAQQLALIWRIKQRGSALSYGNPLQTSGSVSRQQPTALASMLWSRP